MFGFLKTSKNLIFALRCHFSSSQEIYYPVVNCQLRCSHIYPSRYVSKKPMVKLAEKQKNYEANSRNIKKFLIDQLKKDQLEMQKTKEVVFIGRSNVGKSSLINAIFDQKVAKVSKTPGRTRALYFYELAKKFGILVDGPGYGYTDARLAISEKWRNTLFDYLNVSTRVCKVILLINAEHGVKSTDLKFLRNIQHLNLKIQVVLTKSDKIKREKLFDKCMAVGMQLMKFKNVEYLVHAVSANNGFGIDQLKASLVEAFERYPTRDLKGKEETLIKLLLENKTLRPKKRHGLKLPKFRGAKMGKVAGNRKTNLIENEKTTG